MTTYRRSGVIVPRPNLQKSFKGKPRGRQDDLEITFQECQDLIPKLAGVDLCFNHLFDKDMGKYGPVTGKVVEAYFNSSNQLCIDFDINTENLSGKLMEMVLKENVFSHLSLNTAALKQTGQHVLPIEVSVVKEPARPGSVIYPEGHNPKQGLPQREIRGEYSQLMDAMLRNNSGKPYTADVRASFTSSRMESSSSSSSRHDARHPSNGKFVTGEEFAELQRLRAQANSASSSSSSSSAPMDVDQEATSPTPAAQAQPTQTPESTSGAAPMDVDQEDPIASIATDPTIPDDKKQSVIRQATAANQREADLKRKLAQLEEERDALRKASEAHAQQNKDAIGLFQSVLKSFVDPEDTERQNRLNEAFKAQDMSRIAHLANAPLESVAAALHGKGILPSYLTGYVKPPSPAPVPTKRARTVDNRASTKAVAAAKAASSSSGMTPEVKALMCAYHDSQSGLSGNGMRHVPAGHEVRGARPFYKRGWNAAFDSDPTFQALVDNSTWPEGLDCSSMVRLNNVISGTVTAVPPNRMYSTTTDLVDMAPVAAGQELRAVPKVSGDLSAEVAALQSCGLGIATNGSSYMTGSAASLMIY